MGQLDSAHFDPMLPAQAERLELQAVLAYRGTRWARARSVGRP